MASLTNQEIEQLKQELEKKQQEIKEIYNKLVEAGAWPIDEDDLDIVGGGRTPLADRGTAYAGHTARVFL